MKEKHRTTIGFNRPAVVWKDHNKPAEDWKCVDVDNTAVGPCFVFTGFDFRTAVGGCSAEFGIVVWNTVSPRH